MHKASCSIKDVPYFFSRLSIIFQGHTGQKLMIWRLLGRSQLSSPSNFLVQIKMLILRYHLNWTMCTRNVFLLKSFAVVCCIRGNIVKILFFHASTILFHTRFFTPLSVIAGIVWSHMDKIWLHIHVVYISWLNEFYVLFYVPFVSNIALISVSICDCT